MKAYSCLLIMALTAIGLSGCSTVSVPDIDFLKLPEFREIVKNNQTNVPKVSEIPDEPANVRRDSAWDKDAAQLIELRDSYVTPEANQDMRSQEQIDAEFARLKSKAQAYKLDDPE